MAGGWRTSPTTRGSLRFQYRPFPDVNNGQWQVSTSGGIQPLWARNGEELFYLAPKGALMGVRVELVRHGGRPRRRPSSMGSTCLAEHPCGAPFLTRTYDVSPDGKRFLMIKDAGVVAPAVAPASIVVVQNWPEELKRLVPTK